MLFEWNSLKITVPIFLDFQKLDRHRRRGFDWEDLSNFGDSRTDAYFADLCNVSTAKSMLLRMYQNWCQVPVAASVKRTFK